MSYYVRPMHQQDITQVTEIDREAFPTQWPSTNYQHELRNRLASYIVVCDDEKIVDQPEVNTHSEKGFTRPVSILRRLFSHHRFSDNEQPPPMGHYVIGFTGFWVIAEEAHIINIAVREAYRRQGIGELLLISLIDMVIELKARTIALEVRVSNTTAQSLYTKYGFAEVAIRRGYYVDRGYNIDNREDGLLMSTQDITAAEFQARLQQLKQALYGKWGSLLWQQTGL